MPKAGGKWNTYEITAKGSQLTVDRVDERLGVRLEDVAGLELNHRGLSRLKVA